MAYNSIAEEAGLGPEWTPIDGPPIVPSAPPASDLTPVVPRYFQGSIAPNFQHDADFVDTATLTPNAPKFDLMPLGPQQNAVSATQISSVVRTTPGIPTTPTVVEADDDTPKINLQTGTAYTVQQSDLNKVISVNNASGGIINLPPITLSTTVAINNTVHTLFTSGNTVVGPPGVATSTGTWVVAGAPIQIGDTLMCCVRLLAGVGGSVSASLSDSVNGGWVLVSQTVNQVTTGNELMCFFYVRSRSNVAIGGSLTLSLVAGYSSVVSNPDVNTVWNVTGLSRADQTTMATGADPGSNFTFGTAGITATVAETFIALGDTDKGSISGSQKPAATSGLAWTSIQANVDMSAAALLGFPTGLVKEVWSASTTTNQQWGAILASFVNATQSDTQSLTDFFCYVENKGGGTFNLVSAAPIDGSQNPLPLSTNQGLLLVYDNVSKAWYTVRGIGFSGFVLPTNALILGSNVAGTAFVDNSATVESNIQNGVWTFASDTGAANAYVVALSPAITSYVAGLTLAFKAAHANTTGSTLAVSGLAAKTIVKQSGTALVANDIQAGEIIYVVYDGTNFQMITPPLPPVVFTGDSGSGGTTGLVPAPPAGSNAAGDFLSAGGSWVNPGSNPTAFNTGLAYAIAAGYALG